MWRKDTMAHKAGIRPNPANTRGGVMEINWPSGGGGGAFLEALADREKR